MNTDRFKFRVWDDKIKRYCACYSLDSDSVIWNGHTAIRLDNKYIQVEFCTGLRDKNGKLIYEGDIVSVYDPLTESHNKCVVEWGEDITGYFSIYLEPEKVIKGCRFASNVGTCLDGPYSEIIGNIHEEERKNENYK